MCHHLSYDDMIHHFEIYHPDFIEVIWCPSPGCHDSPRIQFSAISKTRRVTIGSERSPTGEHRRHGSTAPRRESLRSQGGWDREMDVHDCSSLFISVYHCSSLFISPLFWKIMGCGSWPVSGSGFVCQFGSVVHIRITVCPNRFATKSVATDSRSTW